MPFTRSQAYEALSSLSPAPIFPEAYHTKPLPEDLDIYFGPPEELFLAPDTQCRFGKGRLVPILDDGNFGLVTFLDPESRRLVQIYVETPDEIRARLAGWNDYLSHLMKRIRESVDDDKQIERIGTLIRST